VQGPDDFAAVRNSRERTDRDSSIDAMEMNDVGVGRDC